MDMDHIKSAATLDRAFLGFGFGRHACPGRFFAIHEIKIFVAHMLLHYDVEPLEQRPKLKNLSWLRVPDESATIRVRRIKGTAV